MRAKIVSASVALALVVGLIPSTALAFGGLSLQLESLSMQSASLSAQSVSPKSVSTASKALCKSYKSVLKQAVKGTGPFKANYFASAWDASYAVYDMNSDGIPELLVNAGVYMAGGMNCYVFTVSGGKVQHCGYVNSGFGGVTAGKKGAYVYQAHSGYFGYKVFALSGTKLSVKDAFSGTDLDDDGSRSAFESSAGIKALDWSPCSSYSLLEKNAKISSSKLCGASVSVTKKVAYTGKAQKPKVTVKYLGTKLKAGKDYKVSYKSAKGKKVSKVADSIGHETGS